LLRLFWRWPPSLFTNAASETLGEFGKANPDGPLARNLFPRYLGPLAIKSYEATKHLGRKLLEQHAADLRTEAIRARDAWRAAERAAGRLAPQPRSRHSVTF